jgi:hypothetical protein
VAVAKEVQSYINKYNRVTNKVTAHLGNVYYIGDNGDKGCGNEDKERTIAWEKLSMNTKASRVRVNKKI